MKIENIIRPIMTNSDFLNCPIEYLLSFHTNLQKTHVLSGDMGDLAILYHSPCLFTRDTLKICPPMLPCLLANDKAFVACKKPP